MKASRILIISIAIILIIAAFLFALSAYIHSQLKTSIPAYISYGKPYFNFSIYTDGVLGYENNQYAVPFVVLNYTASNVINATISVNFYTSNPIRNIYYVSSPAMCIGCFNDQEVTTALRYYLERYALLNNATFNVVNIGSIGSIPPNSTIILATGLLPITLMPNSGYNGNTTLLTLLSKGDTVVYVGDNFSRSIGTGSIIFKTSSQSMQVLNQYGLNWSMPLTSSNLFYFSKPTFSLANRYGNVSYTNVLNGTLIAFSNQPTSAWPNASYMARDIAFALYNRFWIPEIAYGNYTLSKPTSGSLGVFALQKFMNYSNIGRINYTYPLVNVVFSNSTNYSITYKRFNVYAKLNGSLSIPSPIAETQTVPIVIGMNINSPTRKLVIPHIDLYTSNMTYVTSIPIGFFNTSTGINIIKYESFGMPSGYYIAILRDFNNRPYAASLFELAGIEISPINLNFRNGTFLFRLSSLGMPIANSTYSISLDNSYLTSGITNNSEILYRLPKGSVIGYGTQTFEINIFNSKYTYVTQYSKEILHIPVYYIEFAIVIIIVIVLNLVIKAPNRDEYYIDIPEIPRSKKTHVVVPKKEILDLFDKINMHYHWKYMPLLPEEIKNGIAANLRYNNMPISITLQNVNIILTKLVNSGDLTNIKDYFAPKRWIDESGYSIEYLATFRRLRDYFVTAGISFTPDLGAAQDADIDITKNGVEAQVFIYAETGKRSKIWVGGDTKKFIVFFDEERKLKFIEALYSSFGDESEVLKVAIANGLIKLIDTEHLDQLII
ncbi:MAG: hypothetical protein RXO35_03970 [Candidatus Micrarchaeota archaeon]